MTTTVNSDLKELERRSQTMKKSRKAGLIVPLKGEQHPQWKGGISALSTVCGANRRLYREWKYPKMVEAGFKCQECGKPGPGLNIHHDKETFSEILHKIAQECGWSDFYALEVPKNDEKLIVLKEQISEAVADYHIKTNVSGKVICLECHKKLHNKLNFWDTLKSISFISNFTLFIIGIMTEKLLNEYNKRDYARAFIRDIEANNPGLYNDLKTMAVLVLTAIRNGRKPSQKLDTIEALLNKYPELDPLTSDDTYGVRAFITALSKNKAESQKAKRFYDRTLDGHVRKNYKNSVYLPTMNRQHESVCLEQLLF